MFLYLRRFTRSALGWSCSIRNNLFHSSVLFMTLVFFYSGKWSLILKPPSVDPFYTIRSVVIFSFPSLYISYDTGKENLFKWFEASLASVHFLHSHNLLVWCRGNSVRRNWMLVIKKFFLMLEMDHNIVRFVLSQVVSYGPMGHYNCHLDSDLIRPNKPCCHYVGSELGHCRVCR